jgi:hypothetical protein
MTFHPVPEEQPHADPDILRVSEEAEQHARLLVGVDTPGGHDAFYPRRLPHVADVHGRLEPWVNGSGVEQDADCCLGNRVKRHNLVLFFLSSLERKWCKSRLSECGLYTKMILVFYLV